MKKLLSRISLAVIVTAIQIPVYAFDSVPMHTIDAHTYRMTFSGKVSSPQRDMTNTDVRAEVRTATGKLVQGSTQISADGEFTVSLAIDGYPNEQIDWNLSAQSGYLSSVTHEGRQILSDVMTVQVNESMDLSEHVFALAHR